MWPLVLTSMLCHVEGLEVTHAGSCMWVRKNGSVPAGVMSSSGWSSSGAMSGSSVPVRLTVSVGVGVPATTWTSKVTACMSSAVVRAVGADAVALGIRARVAIPGGMPEIARTPT